MINQADVALLTYPLNFPMPTQVAYDDLTYYSTVTRTNGTLCVFAVIIAVAPCCCHIWISDPAPLCLCHQVTSPATRATRLRGLDWATTPTRNRGLKLLTSTWTLTTFTCGRNEQSQVRKRVVEHRQVLDTGIVALHSS